MRDARRGRDVGEDAAGPIERLERRELEATHQPAPAVLLDLRPGPGLQRGPCALLVLSGHVDEELDAPDARTGPRAEFRALDLPDCHLDAAPRTDALLDRLHEALGADDARVRDVLDASLAVQVPLLFSLDVETRQRVAREVPREPRARQLEVATPQLVGELEHPVRDLLGQVLDHLDVADARLRIRDHDLVGEREVGGDRGGGRPARRRLGCGLGRGIVCGRTGERAGQDGNRQGLVERAQHGRQSTSPAGSCVAPARPSEAALGRDRVGRKP